MEIEAAQAIDLYEEKLLEHSSGVSKGDRERNGSIPKTNRVLGDANYAPNEDFEMRMNQVKVDKKKEKEVEANIKYGYIVLPRKFKLHIEFIEETPNPMISKRFLNNYTSKEMPPSHQTTGPFME